MKYEVIRRPHQPAEFRCDGAVMSADNITALLNAAEGLADEVTEAWNVMKSYRVGDVHTDKLATALATWRAAHA